MRICSDLNKLQGIVQEVSSDKSKISLLLPRGGTIKARNEGFETGDHVCIIIDPIKKKVLKVLPKIIADLTVVIGSNPILQSAIRDAPEELEIDFDEYEFEPEEITIEENDHDKEDPSGERKICVFEGDVI